MSSTGITNEQKNVEKALQKENKGLKSDVKQMEMKIKNMTSDLNKSNNMKDRLEALCRELQKQNKFIKAESSAKIHEANQKGKELALEVQNNMGFMKNINENLASITTESMKVKKENEELAKKIAILKDHYDQREKILQTALDDTNAVLLATKTDLSALRLKNAEEKEKLYGEMQQLASALVSSREHLKEAKATEESLRVLIQNYDEKFSGLQRALKETNSAYDDFKREMNKVTTRTKELELESFKWQSRWEESDKNLQKMRKNHMQMQEDMKKAEEGLDKMTNLCRALQNERKEMLKALKDEESKNEKSLETMKEETARATPEPAAEIKIEASAEIKNEAPAEIKNEAPAEIKNEAPAEVKIEVPAEIKVEYPAETKVEVLSEIKNETPVELKKETPMEKKANPEEKKEKPEGKKEKKKEKKKHEGKKSKK